MKVSLKLKRLIEERKKGKQKIAHHYEELTFALNVKYAPIMQLSVSNKHKR